MAEQAYERLGAAILCGELSPGAKISEPILARQYGISRGPLREALHRLQERKLITRSANQGARVIQPTATSLNELFAVREALEGMAARLTARHATDADLAHLRTVAAETSARHDQPTGAELGRGNTYTHDFHAAIARASRNDMLIGLLCTELYPLLRLYREMLPSPKPGTRRITIEHEHIILALEDRDADLAEMLMRRHIAAARIRREKEFARQEPAPAQDGKATGGGA